MYPRAETRPGGALQGVNPVLADRIRQLRQERRWTQAELAEAFDVTLDYLAFFDPVIMKHRFKELVDANGK